MKAKKKTQEAPWRNRIVGYGEEAPDQLLAHDKNARIHPMFQQQALSGVLREVGLIQNVIVCQRSQKVLDGHLRIALAMSEGQPTLPITYVDLGPEEEALILSTFDPIGALAVTDKQVLESLLHDVQTGEIAVQELLDKIATEAGIVPGVDSQKSGPETPAPEAPEGRYKEQYGVIVVCQSEEQQQEVYEKLTADGLECKVVVT